uniref:Uncharacterized protein n=1 Tax=Steinernema glaseri TaxID=37863 RepID=A0A1I8AE72_9BILA
MSILTIGDPHACSRQHFLKSVHIARSPLLSREEDDIRRCHNPM